MLDRASEETVKIVIGLVAACVAVVIIGVVALEKDRVYLYDQIRRQLEKAAPS